MPRYYALLSNKLRSRPCPAALFARKGLPMVRLWGRSAHDVTAKPAMMSGAMM
jgi:hypothetical protein